MGVIRRSLQSLCANITTNATTTTTASATATTTTTIFNITTSIATKASLPLVAAKDSAATNTSFICTATGGSGSMSEQSSLDALFYIVVVLLFYAFSIVVLMIKYIRRENREAYLRQYFEEFVTREKFEAARVQNQFYVLQMKNAIKGQIRDPDVRAVADPDEQGQTISEQRVLLESIPETVCEEDDESESACEENEQSPRRETPV